MIIAGLKIELETILNRANEIGELFRHIYYDLYHKILLLKYIIL